MAKNVPIGSDNAYAVMKAALEKTNAGYEQWMKMTQQAAKQIEAKMTDAATGFAAATKKATSAAAATTTRAVAGPAKKAAGPAKKTASPAKKTAARKK